ncbi:Negative regulator of sexual conjugation and meiosis [Leucoagaricus sp. SymC.cos]|nr:Negative regulator of sexual conjugation and meiosis [Leucoagaricus sp. SymC.cos]
MSTKCNFQLSPVHPPIGTLIDGGSLQLVEVLGVGGYGVVYRAIEARPSTMTPKSYAVKCLIAPPVQNPRSRQVHIREIALHQLASRHPGIVTLHRVVDCLNLTYIIMDYAPDHDLFTQILHSCRYLGDDTLIKHVFLQLLDAVEYCHSLGIYHRDLKPENILCYDDGLRIAITDFGLATTEKVSDEFRTGSVFHMSPECQGAAFAPQGTYSPMHNDIWSLGIILLNLATGRNPWKSATADDPTFQAYLRSPSSFLPSVLPISPEVNKILVGMLNVDYRRRSTLREVRRAIAQVTSFYSNGVIFEGSMARCPWESGMDIDTDSSEDTDPPAPRSPSPLPEASRWSKDTNSEIVFRQPLYAEESTCDEIPWNNRSSCGATWAYESTESSSSSSTSSSESEPGLENSDMFDGSRTPSETSIQSPVSSLPTTPNSAELAFGSKASAPNRKPLTINTNIPRPRFYDHDASFNTFSEDSAIMQTAIEYDPYSSMFYVASVISESKIIALPTSAVTATATAVAEDKEMTSPSIWQETQGISSPSVYSRSSSRTSSSSFVGPRTSIPRPSRTPMLSPSSVFLRSNSPSPEPNWAPLRAQRCQVPGSIFTEQSQHLSPVVNSIAMTDILSSPLSSLSSRQPHIVFPQPPAHTPSPYHHGHADQRDVKGRQDCSGADQPKSRPNNVFGIKFFPRSPSPTQAQTRTTQKQAKSPTAKIPPIPSTLTDSPVTGAKNPTDIGSGTALGSFRFEPHQQASSSSCPDASSNDANDRSCRSLVAYDKELAQATNAEGSTSGAGKGRRRRGEGKRGHDSTWFGTWEGAHRAKDRNLGTHSSQVESSGAFITDSGAGRVMGDAQEEAHQQNFKTSSSTRQSRFSVGRRTRREHRSRSPRHWFIPGRFFASAGAAA